ELKFPDPGSKDPILAIGIPLLYGQCPGPSMGTTYQQCAFVRQPDAAETFARATLLRSEVKLKDPQLLCLADAQGQDIGATQEESSQIKGFTLTPSAPSIARFIMAPRNSFVTALFDPLNTVDGVPITEYEPNLLFALEATQPDVTIDGQPVSFIEAAKSLLLAFDDHEFFEDTVDGPTASQGYMFSELMNTLHMHWPSPRIDP